MWRRIMRFNYLKQLDTGIGCTMEDYMFLYALIAILKPKRIVEIGTNTGVGTITMALSLKENEIPGKIYTFDIAKHVQDIAVQQINEMEVNDYIYVQHGDSDYARGINLPYELAYIDGDHTYEGCKKDFENLADRAKYFIFHDTGSCVGVKQFTKEFDEKVVDFCEPIKQRVYNKGVLTAEAWMPGFVLWKKEG